MKRLAILAAAALLWVIVLAFKLRRVRAAQRTILGGEGLVVPLTGPGRIVAPDTGVQVQFGAGRDSERFQRPVLFLARVRYRAGVHVQDAGGRDGERMHDVTALRP